jgi:orotate phosphoribosyltransferase-like protein
MLFEEWAGAVENELLEVLENNYQNDDSSFDINQIADELKVSEDTVLFFLSRLIKDRKVEVVELKIK